MLKVHSCLTFGRLKGKFRRLRDLDVCTADVRTEVIAAVCVLHNFIIKNDNKDDEYEDHDEEPEPEDDN